MNDVPNMPTTNPVSLNNYHDTLNELAKESFWSGRLIVKEGVLQRGSRYETFIEDIKDLCGFASGTNPLLVEFKIIELLESLPLNLSDLDSVKAIAAKAGLTEKTEKNHGELNAIIKNLSKEAINENTNPKSNLKKFYFSHFKELGQFSELTSTIQKIPISEIEKMKLINIQEIIKPNDVLEKKTTNIELNDTETKEKQPALTEKFTNLEVKENLPVIPNEPKENEDTPSGLGKEDAADNELAGDKKPNQEARQEEETQTQSLEGVAKTKVAVEPKFFHSEAIKITEPEIAKPLQEPLKLSPTVSMPKKDVISSRPTKIYNQEPPKPEVNRDKPVEKVFVAPQPPKKPRKITPELIRDFNLAISKNDVNDVFDMLKLAPGLVNAPFEDGTPPLIFAIRQGKPAEDIIHLLLKSADLNLCDAKGFDAFDICTQGTHSGYFSGIKQSIGRLLSDDSDWCEVLGKKILRQNLENSWKVTKISYQNAQNVIDKTHWISLHYDPIIDPQIIQMGYEGHNPLLLKAIDTGDYKACIRIVMAAGQEVLNSKDSDGNTLLHHAVQSGHNEIICFLLQPKVSENTSNRPKNLMLETNHQGQTPLELAKTLSKTEMIEMIMARENPSAASPEMAATINQIEENIKTYKQNYAAWLSKNPQEAEIFKNVAKHGGSATGRDNTAGHNQFVLQAIANKDLSELATLMELGASVDTVGVTPDEAMKDPLSRLPEMEDFFQSLRKAQESAIKSIDEEWNKVTYGRGKTLLDLAIILDDGSQKSLDIIALLMTKSKNALNLIPSRPNDEGEFATRMAIFKGNLSAVMLLGNYSNLHRKMPPDILKKEDPSFERSYTLLKEESIIKDPLYLNWPQAKQLAFSLAFFGSQYYFGSGVSSYVAFVALFADGIGQETLKEKLAAKPQKTSNIQDPLNISEETKAIVTSALPYVQKAYALEILGVPGPQIGSVAMHAFSFYTGIESSRKEINRLAPHFPGRPFKATLKLGATVLPTFKSFMLLCNSTITPMLSLMQEQLRSMKGQYVKTYNATERLKLTIDHENKHFWEPTLDSKDPVDADFIFAGDESYNETNIKRVFRNIAMTVHPDKVDPEKKAEAHILTANLNNAYEILEKNLQNKADPERIAEADIQKNTTWLSPTIVSVAAPFALTAAKVAGIIGIDKISEKISKGTDFAWKLTSWSIVIYPVSSLALGVMSMGYGAFTSFMMNPDQGPMMSPVGYL